MRCALLQPKRGVGEGNGGIVMDVGRCRAVRSLAKRYDGGSGGAGRQQLPAFLIV